MNGWIIYNGNLKSDKIYELVQWLVKTAQTYNLTLHPVKNSDLLFYFDTDAMPRIKSIQGLKKPNFVISWDKDIPLARHFEMMNIKVYNSSEGIHACDNKILMTKYLAGHGIKMPQTIIAPMVYSNCDIIEYDLYDHIIDELGFPMIIKEAYGSFGAQVYMVKNKEEMFECISQIGNRPHLFQSYIKHSHGRDIRINVVGNQVVASMKRISEEDFRANITGGGRAEIYEPTKEEIDLAIRCTQLLNLDFSGVDLLFGEEGPILCEINGNPHFKSIYECTGVDVSHAMIKYILEDQIC